MKIYPQYYSEEFLTFKNYIIKILTISIKCSSLPSDRWLFKHFGRLTIAETALEWIKPKEGWPF
jgi:hypothetical protein